MAEGMNTEIIKELETINEIWREDYAKLLEENINLKLKYRSIKNKNHDPRTSHVSIISTNKINIKGQVLPVKHDKQVSELKRKVMLLQNQIGVYEAITDELFRGTKEEEINTCFQRNEVLRKHHNPDWIPGLNYPGTFFIKGKVVTN